MAWRLSTGIRDGLLNTAANSGGGLAELLKDGVIEIYSGTQPADADSAEAGTLLCVITEASGVFTGGVATNGLNFDPAASGVIDKLTGEVWSGANTATGTAGWFRFYANDFTKGASTTAVRLDGAIATSGSQMNLSNTALVSSVTTTVDSVAITQPAS